MEQGVYKALKYHNKVNKDDKLLVEIEYDDAKILLDIFKEKALGNHKSIASAKKDLERFHNLFDTIDTFETFVYEYLLDNGDD